MRKIFTVLSALLLCGFASQAAVSAKMGDKEIKNGDVIQVTAADFQNLGMMQLYMGEIQFTTNTGGITFDLSSDSNKFQFCVTTCHDLKPEGNLYTLNVHGDGNDINTHLQVTFMGDAIPNDINTYVDVTATDELGQTLKFKAVLNTTGGASVKGIGAESVRLQVANGSVLANGSTTGVEVFSLLGQRVPNRGLHGVYVVKYGKTVKKLTVR